MAAAKQLVPILILCAALAACAPRPPGPDKLVLTPSSFGDLPGWEADEQVRAVPALRRSCRPVLAGSVDRKPPLHGRAPAWRAMCAALAALEFKGDRSARAFFERWFEPHAVAAGADAQGLFTGYYEPQLNGARRRDRRYRVPLYVRPPDLVTVDLGAFRDEFRGERIAGRLAGGRLKPYETRAAIDDGALVGKGLELLWLDDPVDAFFLHIQGSGRVVMADGGVIRVGYAASNGQPYSAIGRELAKSGEIPLDRVSMQTIRAWLAAHPDRARRLMQSNRSFIFFREITGDGPVGAQGVALTPGRSLAVDRNFIPLGLPVWIDTRDPLDADTPLRRLMVAQDTGGAIRGAVRGDVFWGHGRDAAQRAGLMNSRGRYFLLLPRAAMRPTS